MSVSRGTKVRRPAASLKTEAKPPRVGTQKITCAKGREADKVKIAYSKNNRSRPTGYGKACSRAEQASTTVISVAKPEEVKTE